MRLMTEELPELDVGDSFSFGSELGFDNPSARLNDPCKVQIKFSRNEKRRKNFESKQKMYS